jgi:ribosome maturation factor RimP
MLTGLFLVAVAEGVGASPRLLSEPPRTGASRRTAAQATGGTEVSALLERVRPIVAPILADLGLDLYDLEMQSGTVRVTVDRDGGVDLEAIALATRLISRELDHRDPIPGKYTLEVSSPGLERNLRTPDHFQRVIGWKVQVRTQPGVTGDRRVHGLLVAADDEGFTVRPELDGGAPAPDRRLGYDDVDRARTLFEWAATPKPASQPKKPGVRKVATPGVNDESPVAKTEEEATKP